MNRTVARFVVREAVVRRSPSTVKPSVWPDELSLLRPFVWAPSARAEDGRSNAYERGAFFDGDREIMRHAHGKLG